MTIRLSFLMIFAALMLICPKSSATVYTPQISYSTYSTSIKKTHLRPLDRIKKGEKLKGIAGFLLGISFFLFVIGAGIAQHSPFSPAAIIFVLLAFACFAIGLILFLIGLAMQHLWN